MSNFKRSGFIYCCKEQYITYRDLLEKTNHSLETLEEDIFKLPCDAQNIRDSLKIIKDVYDKQMTYPNNPRDYYEAIYMEGRFEFLQGVIIDINLLLTEYIPGGIYLAENIANDFRLARELLLCERDFYEKNKKLTEDLLLFIN